MFYVVIHYVSGLLYCGYSVYCQADIGLMQSEN